MKLGWLAAGMVAACASPPTPRAAPPAPGAASGSCGSIDLVVEGRHVEVGPGLARRFLAPGHAQRVSVRGRVLPVGPFGPAKVSYQGFGIEADDGSTAAFATVGIHSEQTPGYPRFQRLVATSATLHVRSFGAVGGRVTGDFVAQFTDDGRPLRVTGTFDVCRGADSDGR
jgi:hypothetical protein